MDSAGDVAEEIARTTACGAPSRTSRRPSSASVVGAASLTTRRVHRPRRAGPSAVLAWGPPGPRINLLSPSNCASAADSGAVLGTYRTSRDLDHPWLGSRELGDGAWWSVLTAPALSRACTHAAGAGGAAVPEPLCL